MGVRPTGSTPQELDAFRYDCDAYYLNVDLHGAHKFRISDASFAGRLRFGLPAGHAMPLQPGASTALVATRDAADLAFEFHGAHTLRLAVAPGADAAMPRAELTVGAQTYADPDAAVPADAVARSLSFDSRRSDPPNKWPPGSVTAGTHVDFFMSALPGVTSATLVVDRRRLEGPQEVLEYSEVARVPLQIEATVSATASAPREDVSTAATSAPDAHNSKPPEKSSPR